MQLLQGAWKRDGYVVTVPAALWSKIQVIRVSDAQASIINRDPSVFYVVIPGAIHDADDWVVGVTEKGALRIGPPREHTATSGRGGGSVTNIASGNIRGGVNLGRGRAPRIELPTIGLALPRNIPVQDRL